MTKYLSWVECLGLLFGESDEPEVRRGRLEIWEAAMKAFPRKRLPPGAKLKTVEITIKKGTCFESFLSGGVYVVEADDADKRLIPNKIGVETKRKPSSKNELKKICQGFLSKIDNQVQVRDRVYKAIKYDGIKDSVKVGATAHWKIEKNNFFLWAKEHWNKISPLRHFLSGQSDDLREYVEYHRSADVKKPAKKLTPRKPKRTVKKSTRGRQAPAVKQAVIEEAKRIRKGKPGIKDAALARHPDIVKRLKPGVLLTNLKDLDEKAYGKHTGHSLRNIERWIAESRLNPPSYSDISDKIHFFMKSQ